MRVTMYFFIQIRSLLVVNLSTHESLNCGNRWKLRLILGNRMCSTPN